MDKRLQIFKEISISNEKKLLLLVVDGLGGVPNPETNKTELETANIPNINELAKNSLCGLLIPLLEGITPGSGPAHLSLFGYDPVEYMIGRGVLEALGLGIELGEDDLSCRANFATLDYEKKKIVDRRAGRQATEETVRLCKILQDKIKKVGDVEIIIKPGKGHRFVVVFRGEGLSERITENDPQKEGLTPKEIKKISEDGEKTEKIVNEFLEKVCQILKTNQPANYILLRGFTKYPKIPKLQEIFKLKPAAIATYPMYKGLARLVGMEILECREDLGDEIETLEKNFEKYDFFYLHIKETDSYGEDGNFLKKVQKIEEIDKYIPRIRKIGFDVIALTGDHSTPAVLRSHSWHYVPVCLYSIFAGKNDIKHFSERECLKGSLGKISSKDLLPLMLANALRLSKYGP